MGAFLDTTIVVDLIKVSGESAATKHIAAHPPAEAAYYAIRELLAGPVQILCQAHNAVLAARNSAEATLSVLRLPSVAGRKRDSVVKEITATVAAMYRSNPGGPRSDVRQEVLNDLALRAQRMWKKGSKLKNVSLAQNLSCFNRGELDFDNAGGLRGPNGRFECLKAERCAAAAYLAENKDRLLRMVEALRPENLTQKQADKNENKKRRVALREIAKKLPRDFDKSRCRAIGDAYFAGMCPAGSHIVTTNLDDFQILCKPLGISVAKP